MRTFGRESVREPFQRKSSISSLHGEGRGGGGRGGGGGTHTRFWPGGTGGAVRWPDPPALCAVKLQTRLVLSRAGRRHNPDQTASPNFSVVLMDFGECSVLILSLFVWKFVGA